MIKMIFAIEEERTPLGYKFGYQDGLPWPFIKEDMEHFRKYTENCTICCSQKTADTLPKSVYTTLGRSLFIIKRDTLLQDLPKNACIIGGAKIIEDWYQCANEISITFISNPDAKADVYLNGDVVDSIFHNMDCSDTEGGRLSDIVDIYIFKD